MVASIESPSQAITGVYSPPPSLRLRSGGWRHDHWRLAGRAIAAVDTPSCDWDSHRCRILALFLYGLNCTFSARHILCTVVDFCIVWKQRSRNQNRHLVKLIKLPHIDVVLVYAQFFGRAIVMNIHRVPGDRQIKLRSSPSYACRSFLRHNFN